MKKANEAKFFFLCSGLDESTFEVAEFSGIDRISSPYQFDITLISVDEDIDVDAVINKQATLFMYRDGEYCPYSGLVSEFHFLDKNTDYCTYSVRLVPRIWAMGLNVQSRIFQRLSIPEIVKKVINEAGLKEFEVNTSQTYPVQDFIVQYQESDLNFISRLMESVGIWYFFKENPLLEEEINAGCTNEKIVISDAASSFVYINGESSVIYRSQSGMNEAINQEAKESIHEFKYDKHVVPKDVFLKNFNYRTPEVELSGKQLVKGGHKGTVYAFGGSFKNTSEAQRAAKIISNQISAEQIIVTGASNCAGLRAGNRYTLSEHFRDSFNTNYLLTHVTHKGGHVVGAGVSQLFSYKNQFRCIPGSQADMFAPEKRAIVPKVHGITTGLIEANGSDYAALDDMGRYKVRLPFDISGSKNYEASKYVRLAQPYSGAKYGMHFPSHEGAEMILACVDGDPNKPLGIGTIPNANTISPVVSANKQENVIKTAGGNEFILDDTDAKQKIKLKTKASNNLLFDDENKKICITSTDGNAFVLDDKNENVVWNGKEHSIKMDYKSGQEGIVISTAGGNIIKIDDKKKMITIQSKGGHSVQMDDEGKKIVLKDGSSKNTVTLDGNKGLSLESQGKIQITAQQDLEIKAANIKMTANAAIEMKATADMKMKGMNIEAKGDMNVKIEAGMNLDLKANMNATVKGGMNTKVEGMMVDVNGSAMTKIKGGIVMIN